MLHLKLLCLFSDLGIRFFIIFAPALINKKERQGKGSELT